MIDLKRNVDNTFKSEPNYKIKKKKLVRLDEKREGIEALIKTTEELINGEEEAFFCIATDEELGHLTDVLRLQFYECSHNLIEIQKQIINYLNQIEYQNKILVKVRQLKYLKDQFELESKTNIREVLASKNPLSFEPSPSYPLRLSADYLRSGDDALESIRKVYLRVRKNGGTAKKIAGNIAGDYLVTQTAEEVFINLEEVKNGFLASGSDLFTFVMAFRSQGRACFRFLDIPYSQDYFISPGGRAFDSWDQIRQALGRKVYYSRKIEKYEEYRDIIFGNNKGLPPEFRKFAITESSQYQNIPRTIQNVFLNSKLEASFIKDTIIMSLSEENASIDLMQYGNHLKNFEEEYKDISKWHEKDKDGNGSCQSSRLN